MNALNIRSWADLRAFLYVSLPVITGLVVSAGVSDDNTTTLWVAFGLALAGPVVAFYNARTISNFRAAFYAVAGAVSALLIFYGALSSEQLDYWMGIVSVVLNLVIGGVAAANTDTTSSSGVLARSPGAHTHSLSNIPDYDPER